MSGAKFDHGKGRDYGKHLQRDWLYRAAITVETRAKEILSTPGTGKVKGKQVGPVTHSAPGDPPFKQTGRLRASVTYVVDLAKGIARVGTNLKYGRWLELGTKRGLAPRPWLRRALRESQALLKRLAR